MRTLVLAAILIHAASAASAQSDPGPDSVHLPYDRSYPTVRIGDQRWMTENLGAPRFANGDSIPEAKSASEWEEAWEAERPAWSYYEGNSAYGDVYGKLYNRAAVRDDRGLCPDGWRVPTDRDWKRLEIHLGLPTGEAEDAGWRGDMGGRLKSTRATPDPHPRWDPPNTGATNESGFSALPGGYRTGRPNYSEQQQASFRMLGSEASYWDAEGGGRALAADRAGVFRGDSRITAGFGLAVRCVSEAESGPIGEKSAGGDRVEGQ